MLFTTLVTGTDPGGPRGLLFVDVATGARMLPADPEKTILGAAWSPDGQTIAFVQCDWRQEEVGPLANCGLWLMARSGGDTRQVLAGLSDQSLWPQWTPDGTRLLFTEFRSAVVWSVRTDGTDLRPVAWNVRDVQVVCQR